MANEILKKIGIGLMGFGEGLNGAPYLTNYQRVQGDLQEQKMRSEMDQKQMKARLAGDDMYPVDPQIKSAPGFNPGDYFTLDGQMYNKAPKKYFQTMVPWPNGEMYPAIGTNDEGFGVQFSGAGPMGPKFDVDTPTDIFNRSTKIRDEFINRPEVKDFVTIDTNVKSMDSLLSKALAGGAKNKLSLDQALITMFNKLTDPQSVVRESEYARTPDNLPLLNRFEGAFRKVEEGGAGLTNEDRKALVWGAKVIANQRGATFNDALSAYGDLADQAKVKRDSVTRGFKEFKPYSFEENRNISVSGWPADKEKRYEEWKKTQGGK